MTDTVRHIHAAVVVLLVTICACPANCDLFSDFAPNLGHQPAGFYQPGGTLSGSGTRGGICHVRPALFLKVRRCCTGTAIGHVAVLLDCCNCPLNVGHFNTTAFMVSLGAVSVSSFWKRVYMCACKSFGEVQRYYNVVLFHTAVLAVSCSNAVQMLTPVQYVDHIMLTMYMVTVIMQLVHTAWVSPSNIRRTYDKLCCGYSQPVFVASLLAWQVMMMQLLVHDCCCSLLADQEVVCSMPSQSRPQRSWQCEPCLYCKMVIHS
jgi:hypothetical protein